MPVSVSTELYGVRESLRILGEIDKKQKFAAIAKIKAAGSDMVAAAQETYPSDTELSQALEGWSPKGRSGYQKSKANRGVKLKVGGRQPRNANAYAVVTLVQEDPGAALYDIAGLRDGAKGKPGGPDRLGRRRDPKQSRVFLQALDAGFGKAQRGMWNNQKRIRELSTKSLRKALDEVAASVNRKLVE